MSSFWSLDVEKPFLLPGFQSRDEGIGTTSLADLKEQIEGLFTAQA